LACCSADSPRPQAIATQPVKQACRSQFVVTVDSRADFRRGRVGGFELQLRAAPRLKTGGREIIDARFVDPQRLLAERDIPPFIRDCVFRVCALTEQLPVSDDLAK
jgi:hypothetical protein